MLSLFLSRDGGPREGAIRLPLEKNSGVETIPEEPLTPVFPDEEPRGVVNQLKKKVSKRLSGYFAKRVHDAHGNESSSLGGGTPPVPLSSSVRRTSNAGARTSSGTSRINGSAYGYGIHGVARNRLASNASLGLAGRRGSLASTIVRRRSSRTRGGIAASPGGNGDHEGGNGGELNFAQRLLMANENAVTNIADLWVAAAMNVDNEDVFMSDSEHELGEDETQDPFVDEDIEEEGDSIASTPTRVGRSGASSSLRVPGVSGFGTATGSRRPSGTTLTPQHIRSSPHRPSVGQGGAEMSSSRRPSTSGVPAIFSHTGVRTPPAMLEQMTHSPQREGRSTYFTGVAGASAEGSPGPGLEPIQEGQSRPSTVFHQRGESEAGAGGQMQTALQAEAAVLEKPPSLISQLPMMVIIQYGLLALHSTTHDQIFLSYLVS